MCSLLNKPRPSTAIVMAVNRIVKSFGPVRGEETAFSGVRPRFHGVTGRAGEAEESRLNAAR